MTHMMSKVVPIVVSLIFLFPTKGLAYDTSYVHPEINDKATRQSAYLERALQSLGYREGVQGIVNNKEIYKWLRDGGEKEDAPLHRANNHFHNPLKAWNNAGLSGNWLGMSSLIWAQDQQWLGGQAGGDWSWKRGRAIYYEALTTNDRTIREQKLADTFRAVGQAMHLVADSSVPAHTRNDIHIFPLELFGLNIGQRQTYESWAKRNWNNLTYTAKPVDQSIFSRRVFNPAATVPISALWDLDQYRGSNPEVTWTTNPSISEYGLAEYTNANYFSEDTIFSGYPHPRKENTTARLIEQRARDGTLDRVWYIMGYQTERLAALSFFWESGASGRWQYNLDDNVYKSYSENLIPRAVGYNIALLNYFFRGSIEITSPSQYVYSIIDGSLNPQQFTKIKAKIRNTTSEEEMLNGTIQAVARYRKIPDYNPDLLNYPPDAEQMSAVDYLYSVSRPISIMSLSSATPKEFTFDFSNYPIPVGITDLTLQVIFKGTLGNEADTAIAVGMKDLMEPAHHVFWNLSDRFSLDGHLYNAEDIKTDPELSKRVDAHDNGTFNDISAGEPYIDPYPMTLKAAYFGTYPPQGPVIATAEVENLSEGRHIRLIILTDKQDGNYMRFMWSDSISTNTSRDFEFNGTVNQGQDGNWESTPIAEFRGLRQHLELGVLRCEPMARDQAGNTYCPYPDAEAVPPSDLTPVRATIMFP